MDEKITKINDERKPYEKPQIILELELETRAGSIIPPGSPEDVFGEFPQP